LKILGNPCISTIQARKVVTGDPWFVTRSYACSMVSLGNYVRLN